MRILSGLAGKMAPVAGSPGKAVSTPPAAFTSVQQRVIPVSQRRRGDSRGGEVQQQAGTVATIIVASNSDSVESESGGGNRPCCGCCLPGQDSGGGGTAASCSMEGRETEQQSPVSKSSINGSKDAAPSRNRRGSIDQQSVFSSARIRDSRVADTSRKSQGIAEQQFAVSRKSSSRVRQYRKRVNVRWGSLQWSLALVLVVRSTASCQEAAHRHAVTTSRPLTVA